MLTILIIVIGRYKKENVIDDIDGRDMLGSVGRVSLKF